MISEVCRIARQDGKTRRTQLQLYHACRFETLLERAAAFVREQSAQREILIVAPAKGAADDLARSVCDTALGGVHRATLYQLATGLSETALASRGLAPCSAIAREAVAARTVALCSGKLKYFAPVAGRRGFPKALARTLNELRMGGVRPASLAAFDGPCADLGVLLDCYEAELRVHGLADDADRYRTAVIPKGLALLLLDLAPETEAERSLLRALVRESAATLAVQQLATKGLMEEVLGCASSELPSNGGSRLSAAQQNLFESTPAVPGEDETIECFSASGEALEAIEMARHLQRAAASGVRFDEIAVLLRSPMRSQPLVTEALRRANIPAYFSQGTQRPDAPGRAFLTLLHCVHEGLPASRFGEYLSLGQLPETVESATGWERLIAEASVLGGVPRWQRRLQALRDQIHRRYEGAEQEDKSRLGERLERLDALRDFAIPVLDALGKLPRHGTWVEWLEHLEALAELTLRDPESVVELLDQLRPLGETGPVELSDVIQLLEAHLLTFQREPAGDRYGKVFVGTIEEARGRSFRIVCLPGLNEGLFPRVISEDPLLLNHYRSALKSGLPLACEEGEKLLLHTAVACASEKLIVSYSRLDLLSGRPRVLSLYAIELMRAAGWASDVRALEEQARSRTETRVGWPAPVQPEDAIDDAEFDLAVLRPAFDGSHPAGAGAYLKSLSSALTDSLRARGRRWRKSWFAEDGLMKLDIEGEMLLDRHRLTKRAYSASALQHYAACPYRFALRSIHGLRPLETKTFLHRMDTLIRGTLFHSIQFEFLKRMGAERRLPLTQTEQSGAFATLEETIGQVAAEAEEMLAPAIEPVWRAEIRELRQDLFGWLQQAFEEEPEWEPIACELSFGLKETAHHDERSSQDAVTLFDRYLLQGSIDLVAQHPTGALRVVDHKTGKPPRNLPRFVGGGEILQPLLYAAAAERLLGRAVQQTHLHYATLRGNFRKINLQLNQFAITRVEQALRTIDSAIEKGFLPAAPREDACKQCEYRSVCGPYEEERIRLKPAADIRPLTELRNIP